MIACSSFIPDVVLMRGSEVSQSITFNLSISFSVLIMQVSIMMKRSYCSFTTSAIYLFLHFDLLIWPRISGKTAFICRLRSWVYHFWAFYLFKRYYWNKTPFSEPVLKRTYPVLIRKRYEIFVSDFKTTHWIFLCFILHIFMNYSVLISCRCLFFTSLYLLSSGSTF